MCAVSGVEVINAMWWCGASDRHVHAMRCEAASDKTKLAFAESMSRARRRDENTHTQLDMRTRAHCAARADKACDARRAREEGTRSVDENARMHAYTRAKRSLCGGWVGGVMMMVVVVGV